MALTAAGAAITMPEHSFFPSLAGLDRALAVIIVSEIGDKTFLLAALLAMRYPRSTVFVGAFAALLIMSILSAALGHVLPALVPRRYTVLAAAALFVVFGAKMLQEGLAMEGGTGKVQEEMKEVEDELREKEDSGALDAIEAGGKPSPRSKLEKADKGLAAGLKNLVQFTVSPILLQTFVMTFLAEWGDRSQISTIALAAAHNVYLVTFGTVLGHSLCTLLAVVGGRWLATRISVKHVTLGGAVLFLIFGVSYMYEGLTWDEAQEAIEAAREAAGAAMVAGADIAP